MIQDAVVPRSRLPEVMADAYRISAKFNLRLANVFHAGDGNLHPFICFDSRFPDEVLRVKEAGRELMETWCAREAQSRRTRSVDKRAFATNFSDDDIRDAACATSFRSRCFMQPGQNHSDVEGLW